MNTLDFIFGERVKKGTMASVLLQNGYVKQEEAYALQSFLAGDGFQTIARLLITMGDRLGHTEERKEDLYAKLPRDLLQLANEMMKEIKREDKKGK